MASTKNKPQPKKLTPEDEAKKLKPLLVLSISGDFNVITANALQGAKALQSADAVLRSQLKAWDGQRSKRLAAIAQAFRRAALDVSKHERTTKTELAAALEQAWPLRRTLLARAQVAASEGLIPQKAVDDILRGTGGIDCADDLDALAKLFTKTWEQTGASLLLTQDTLAKAKALAATIHKHLRPTGQRAITDAQLKAARLLRDRLYTLLTLTHDELWPYAALAFGRADVDANFPSLQSREVESPAAAKPADKPADPPAPKPAAKAKPKPKAKAPSAAETAIDDASAEPTPTGDAQAQALR